MTMTKGGISFDNIHFNEILSKFRIIYKKMDSKPLVKKSDYLWYMYIYYDNVKQLNKN